MLGCVVFLVSAPVWAVRVTGLDALRFDLRDLVVLCYVVFLGLWFSRLVCRWFSCWVCLC